MKHIIKTESVSLLNLKLFLVVILSALFIYSCGKKNESTKTEDKTSTEKSSTMENVDPNSSVMVEFNITGEMPGKMKSYYSGKKSRVEYEMDMKGQKIISTIIGDGEWVYSISDINGKKMGFKMNVSSYSEDLKKKKQFDMTKIKDYLKKFPKEGTEEILGKQCDIYKVGEGTTMSIYKDLIPLKVNQDNGKLVMVATNFEVNPKLPDDFFTPPSDVEFKEFNLNK